MSRNLDFKDDKFNEVALAIGHMVLVWNDLHMVLSDLFHAISRIPNGIATDVLWNIPRQDRPQREMIEKLASLSVIGYNLDPKLKKKISWLLDQINSLETLRNNAVHAPVMKNDDGSVKSWYELGNLSAKGLATTKIPGKFHWFYDSCIVLRQYAEQLSDAVRRPSEPFPRRPSMPNRGDPRYN